MVLPDSINKKVSCSIFQQLSGKRGSRAATLALSQPTLFGGICWQEMRHVAPACQQRLGEVRVHNRSDELLEVSEAQLREQLSSSVEFRIGESSWC